MDIIVEKKNKLITIDVKGLQGTTNFPIDNWVKKEGNHFLTFVSFLNKMDDPYQVPETYIVPSLDIDRSFAELGGHSLIYINPKGNRKVIKLSELRKLKNKYLDNWNYFI